MKTAIATLKSLSPLNQSRQHFVEKLPREEPAAYEERTWREKGHYDEDDNAFIPPMSLKNSIAKAASMLDMKIPGKGNSKYNKHFLAGVMVTDNIPLGVKKKDVQPQWLSMGPKGVKGTTGVLRAFPHFEKWEGSVRIYVLDDTIPKDIFEKVLREAGNFVGLGQFRPEKGGYFGRFELVSLKWE